MKTVELGYKLLGETHFLFTPNLSESNLSDPSATPPADAQGKETFLLSFSKSWEACKLQAQEHEIYGGAWIHGDDSHSDEDIADMDMAKLLNSGPRVKKLSQISA